MMKRFVLAAALALSPTLALAVSPAPLNATVPGSGTPFYFGNNGTDYWPVVQIYDGTTLATVNAGDGGLTVHVANTVAVSSGTLSTAANQSTANGYLSTIATNSGSAIPAGSALIGKVGIDQTTPGTTNGVVVNNTNANGQATMANSSPVVIASNQSSLTVNGGAASGAALSGNPVLMAGGNGTNAYTLKTDTSGDLTIIGNGTLAVQSTLQAGAALVGKMGIDQTTPGTTNAVSLAQIGSGTVATSATGVQKVGIVGNAGAVVDAATGAAPPANALQLGVTASGATGGFIRGEIVCDNHVFKHITSATDTLAVQGVASQTIYVCGVEGSSAGTATYYLENTASANANCSSTLTQIAGVHTVVANNDGGFYNPLWGGLKNTSGNGLCINSTGTGGVDVDVWYTQL